MALVIGIPAFLIGLLPFLRSRKADAVSAQSGASSDSRAGVAQVIDGLKGLIDNLQEDNKGFREDIKQCAARLEAVMLERDELKRELARMRRRWGENGS